MLKCVLQDELPLSSDVACVCSTFYLSLCFDFIADGTDEANACHCNFTHNDIPLNNRYYTAEITELRESLLKNSSFDYGIILLNLLRHALSDLQFDLRLAGIILHEFSRKGLMDNITLFRSLLIVLHLSYPSCSGHCTGSCYEEDIQPDHSCKWYTKSVYRYLMKGHV